MGVAGTASARLASAPWNLSCGEGVKQLQEPLRAGTTFLARRLCELGCRAQSFCGHESTLVQYPGANEADDRVRLHVGEAVQASVAPASVSSGTSRPSAPPTPGDQSRCHRAGQREVPRRLISHQVFRWSTCNEPVK